jgi:hypothetical protein
LEKDKRDSSAKKLENTFTTSPIPESKKILSGKIEIISISDKILYENSGMHGIRFVH